MTDTVKVRLASGRGFALIDAGDAALADEYRWRLATNGYVAISRHENSLYMHRLILCPPPGAQVDHINGVRFDNRRCNLRVATQAQNNANAGLRSDSTSGFKGVSRQGDKWRAYIRRDGRQVYLGQFDTAVEAARVYDAAAAAVFGEFARLNLPHLAVAS